MVTAAPESTLEVLSCTQPHRSRVPPAPWSWMSDPELGTSHWAPLSPSSLKQGEG